MVMTFDAGRTQGSGARGGGRSTGSGIVLATDRSDSFRKARRHTQLVKLLRVVLPCFGVVLCVGVLGLLFGAGGLSTGLPDVPIPRITAQDLSMQNPNYDGVTEDGGTYRVAAERARQKFDQRDFIELEGITADLMAKDKTATKLTAVRGVFNHKEKVLELQEKIEIRSQNGFSADLTSATLRTREGRINSDEPVQFAFPAGSVTARRLEIRQKLREATFVEDVLARLVPQSKPSEKAAGAKPAGADVLIGSADGPVDINAARLDIKDNEKQAIFTGNVRVVQAGATVETPELTAFYEGEAGMPGTAAASGEGTGKLSRITLKGPFVMTRDNGDRVTGDHGSFDAKAETGLLEGNIVMTSVPDRRVTADRVELDQRKDSAVLTGNVVVISGDTVLKGRRLAIDRPGGRTAMTAPPMAGSGPGRITARFVQKPTGSAKKPAAPAQTGGTGIAEFKTDSSAPVDVEADSLDVDDNVRIAVFRGDVVTRQGEITMRSPEIQAHYTGSARMADTTGSKSPADAAGSQLSRIDATGGVAVTTADGRKVTGTTARYEAKANSVVVSGDVELSQAGTVVRGNRLVIDMATGKATIDTSAPKVIAKPSEGWSSEVQGRSTGGRPSAIFFPDELRKAQGSGKKPSAMAPSKAAKPADDVDGWSSETLPAAKP